MSLFRLHVRDRFMAMLTRLMNDDPKTSMRYLLSYIMEPEVAINFTLLGTSSKRAIQKCRFYGCVRSKINKVFKLQVHLLIDPCRHLSLRKTL
ncbi:unnamed protein product [Schistosoma rodhaini]|uniref:Uncharacterized protein n=1 Tax=Schistosoma rodhaini TaxID=6188 RepID=A0AA85ETX1_9TREM|nr:unnamed protein product [Schistosoma rodhaini]CAH8530037.1 unnamed protein product [Schistosoma rodhaini]CAH8661468.1 unnamed protein product [Schistosoma rodhaini]